MMVQRNAVRVEQGEGFALLVHLGQTLDHQVLHNALPGVLRVGADTGDKAHMVDRIVDVHFQRIDGKLGHQRVSIKAAQHIGTFQHRELRLFDLVVLPACGSQLFFRDLKGVAEQCIVLIQILRFQITGQIMVCGVHTNTPVLTGSDGWGRGTGTPRP